MEAMMVLLTGHGMTVAQAGRTLGEHAQRLWRVLFIIWNRPMKRWTCNRCAS
jgi:hypothetical protein